MVALVASTLTTGCVPKGRGAGARAPYLGPTQTISEVISEINANNAPLTTLWATHDFEAWIVDEQKKEHYVNGDGVLLYRKPMELRLIGKKPALDVFEIGSTEERYWMIVRPEMETMWWGYYRNLGKPGVESIPIRPDLLLEVLGVNDINLDLKRPPVPVMRFNPDEDAYMFVWQAPLPDRWVATKEVWYDRTTKLPKLVLLFDANGRVVLRAYLSVYKPVAVPDRAQENWPKVATDYRLYFPDSSSKMVFQLTQVELTHRGIPRPGSIRFPEEPDVKRVIQLDKASE